eukprot:1193965-Prorocentrum_minimum.AAC.1
MDHRHLRTPTAQGLPTPHTPPRVVSPVTSAPRAREGPGGARHHPPHPREGGSLKGNACAPPTTHDKQGHPAQGPRSSTSASSPPGTRCPPRQRGENGP